jgi:hypothetical protein
VIKDEEEDDWAPKAGTHTLEQRVAYLEDLVRVLRLDLHELARVVDDMRKGRDKRE